MSDLSEALDRHGLTVAGQRRRGLRTYAGEEGAILRAEDAALIRQAARSHLALVERVEAGGRIIVETPCEHGEVGAHPTKWMGEPCPGGSRVDVTEEVMG